MTTDTDDLPVDPDWDDVPEELTLLSHLDHGQPTVLDEDGVGGWTVLAVVPGLHAHARRLAEADD